MIIFIHNAKDYRPVVINEKEVGSRLDDLKEVMKSRDYKYVGMVNTELSNFITDATEIVTSKDLKLFKDTCTLNEYGEIRILKAKIRKFEEEKKAC